MDHFVPIFPRIFITHKMLKLGVLAAIMFFCGILYLSAQTQPIVTVRFANPRFNCATNEYCLDVEFQSNTADQSLFGMNVRFFYDDSALEFVNFRNFQGGYGAVAPNPPQIITGPLASAAAFNFSGAAEYVNGAVQLTNESAPAVVISTSGWTKLYEACFTVDGTPNSSNFCPSIVWDLESDPSLGGYSNGSDGVVITVVDPTPQFDSAPAIENVAQFNWQYSGSGAAPFGMPNSTSCISIDVPAPVVGTITQPTCTTPTGSVVLSGLPSGSWTITRTPGNVTTTGNTTSTTISGLPVSGTYTFTVTNSNNCTSPASANVVINAIPANPILGGATAVCVGSTANVTPNTGGTWMSDNMAIATVTDAGVVTGVSAGTVTLTFTETATGCSSTRSVTVTPLNTVTSNATRTLCINTALSPAITHTTTGATGIGTATGLPAGVTAAFASNTITISGTPTAAGTFNYTIPLTGGCGTVNATGTIVVTPDNTVTSNATRTLCINTALSPAITHTTTGATGIGTATGLPAGVTAAFASNTITISGTPTASGTFNYTIPLTGGCGTVNATGTIVVSPNNTVTSNATRTLCINTALSPAITHTTTGATGIGTATGLPAGVTAVFASNTITISGTPTASGTFNYTIPLTGGCGTVNATGTIVVTPDNTVTSNATRTLCINTALSPAITHTTTGATGIGTATGLPAGVTAAFGSNTITISGTPTASGTFNYTIPLTGGCGTVNATGTIVVNPLPSAPIVGTITQPTCTTPTGSVVLSGLPSGNWTLTRTPGNVTTTGNTTNTTISGLPVSSTYTFTVTNSNTCTSPASADVAINAITANPILGGATTVCFGITANVTPNTGGTWMSDNTTIATVTNAGVVTGVSPGTVTLTFIETATGCSSTRNFTVEACCASIETWVYLEGASIATDGSANYSLPMRTTLNGLGLLPGQTYNDFFLGTFYTPAGQPYNGAPWNYSGSEGEGFDSDGMLPTAKANYPSTVVDWVLVSLRDTPDGTGGPICQAAALLHNDGRIEFIDGFKCCGLDFGKNYYIVIEHRNHLIVMSHVPVAIVGAKISYDFRNQQSYISDPFGFGTFSGQKQIQSGKYAMLAGNGNQTLTNRSDTDINFDDRTFWETLNGQIARYRNSDYNLNGDSNFNDRRAWELNNGKFTSVPRN
ncbi:beta strand repeat-containing protein [Haliscomenobacter sp.]|uniref:beta strand repeat-containing protein n=1 Tax=Haliscomenobacter sp. TaxID=2717303 RepID=UPI0035942BE9